MKKVLYGMISVLTLVSVMVVGTASWYYANQPEVPEELLK
jgi:cyclic lactone autoinducer peptide